MRSDTGKTHNYPAQRAPYQHPRRKFATRAEKQRDWVRRNPKSALDADLRCKYGITSDEKTAMVQKQDNKCAACAKDFLNSKDTCVDHCHATNRVRGILCRACNTLLGRIEASADRHGALMNYLKRATA